MTPTQLEPKTTVVAILRRCDQCQWLLSIESFRGVQHTCCQCQYRAIFGTDEEEPR